MLPCISQATTLGTSFEIDIPAFARAGWRGVELWLTKLEQYLKAHSTTDAKAILGDEGIEPHAASFQGGLLLSKGQERTLHWDLYRSRLSLLNELSVPVLVLVPDFTATPTAEDLSRAADSLAEAAELAKTHQIQLALEFQKNSGFCASLDTTVALVAQLEQSNLGICFDAFHFYNGPSKFQDLGFLNHELLKHLQISDISSVPRELATDADRILPGDGDLPLEVILNHIHELGYSGAVSLELLNPLIGQMPVDQVAGVALHAMERALGHLVKNPPDPTGTSEE